MYQNKHKRKRKFWFLQRIIFTSAIIWAISYTYIKHIDPKKPETAQPKEDNFPSTGQKLITTQSVTREKRRAKLQFVGQIEGINQIHIYPDTQTSGILVRNFVTEGTRVRRGQTLMTIDQRSTTGYQYKHLRIRAKISGVVLKIYPERGDFITTQSRLATIAKINRVKVLLNIPQSHIQDIYTGQEAEIQAEKLYSGETFRGRIEQIDPAINPQTLTLQAQIGIANRRHKLKPGMFVKVELYLEAREGIFIPLDSLLMEDNIQYVYTYNTSSKKVTKRIITTGQTHEQYIEVTSGLQEGEQLVIEGNYQVWDGEEVLIKGAPTSVKKKHNEDIKTSH